MALAGSLELQLVADVARLRQDMERMQGIVSRGAMQMQKALDDVRTALGGLFGGVSAAGFGMWIKSTIDFQDQLNDLNKTTNITIGRLAGLSLMSKQTGSDLTGIAQAMNKLTMEMGKAPEKFAKIGISAKDPLEAFKQMSEIFRGISDPQLRAAVAAEALGKSWASAAPALAEGAKSIEEMVKRGEELAGITERDAQMADAFNDSLSELQIALTGNASVLSRSMLPLLTELVKSLTDVSHEAKQTDVGFSVLTETMRAVIVFGGNVAFVVHGIATEIGGLAAQAAAIMRGDFGQAGQISKDMTADAARRRQEFDAWEQRMMSAGRATAGMTEATRELQRELSRMGSSAKMASEAALRGFVDGDAAAKKAADAAKKAAAERKKALEEATKRALEALEEEERFQAEVNKLLNDEQAARARQITSAQQMVKDIEFETKALLMTNVEREKAIALRELEATGIDKSSEKYRQLAADISAAVEQREAVKEHKAMWESIDRTAHDVFVNIFEDGAGTFKRLGQTLKAALLDMLYQMTVKRWIINIGANMTGTSPAAFGGGGGGLSGIGNSFMGGGSSMVGGLGGQISNLMGGSEGLFMGGLNGSGVLGGIGAGLFGSAGAYAGGVAGLSAAGAGSQAAMLAAQTGTFGAAGLSATAAAGAGAAGAAGGGFASMAASAIPVIGWVVAIASILYSIFGKDGGGPKAEGFFNPYNNDRYYSSNNDQVASASRKAAQALQGGYTNLASAFGGSAAIQFGLGFSTDPAGDAPSMLHIGGGRQGVTQFNLHREDIGRDQEELQAAIAEMSSRAMLRGLQLSNLQGILGDFLRSIGDATQLSLDEVQAAVARLQKAAQEKQTLDERWFQMTATEAEKLVRTRQREMEALDISNRAMLARIHALEDEITAQQRAKAAMAELADIAAGIGSYLDRLNATPAGMLPSETQLANARAQFDRELVKARGGDRGALQNITGFGDQLIAAQTAWTASGMPTQNTIQYVKDALAGLSAAITSEEYISDAIGVSTDIINASLQQLIARADANAAAQIAAIAAQANAENAAIATQAAIAQAQASAAAATAPSTWAERRRAAALMSTEEKQAAAAAAAATPGWSPLDGGGFASGGYHSGGWRWVGENGPELEFTGPARIYSAEQSARMVGDANQDLVAEVRALRQQNESLLTRLGVITAEGALRTASGLDAVARNTEGISAQARLAKITPAGA